CFTYQDFAMTGMTEDGLAIGTGCVYPASIKTLPDQLKEIGLSWKGYMEDMGNDPTRESATCGHPVLNSIDGTQGAQAPSAEVPLGDQYATRHNPFMYFHSIIDSPDCATNVVNLNALQNDLKALDTTANFNFITPNLCNDGHDTHCANGDPGGLVSADEFLKKWVPIIMASPAYKKDGLLIINFDEGNYTLVDGKLTFTGAHCCNEQVGPNVDRPAALFGVIEVNGIGGDNTGAVLLSPFIKPGTVTNTPYNHYSLLKSLEDIFKTKGYLGYAGQAGLVPFGEDVFTNR
ncbi:MAG TPA: alkaline phosphatase family protein, partial [Spongiibacteraceae bacterium]|nr:alkaline phosphatase family protein [Spongiibacteraceae bacterium]